MSIVKVALLEELKSARKQSVMFSHQRNNATTSYKKEYFTKKLLKNNRRVVQIVEALNRLPADAKKKADEPIPVSATPSAQ